MYSYYTTTHVGRTIHIIKALADSNHDVQLSLMADRYDSADPMKLASDFGDGYLESNGWSKAGVLNGGIFNTPYANGIEVAYWNIHENDDTSLDGVIAIGVTDTSMTLDTQLGIKGSIGSYRGAVTAAFGLIRDGANYQGNTSAQGAYTSKSGRAIVARGWDGAIYLIATSGVTGSTGLTGAECLDLVKNVLGLKDAVCMDGGGSVSSIFEGSWKVSSSRQIKNAWGLYVKQKTNPGGGGGGEMPTVVRVRDSGYLPITDNDSMHMIMSNASLLRIKEILIMNNGELVPINEIRRETG